MTQITPANGSGLLPARRRFTAEHKLRILQEADRCTSGEFGAPLRGKGCTCRT